MYSMDKESKRIAIVGLGPIGGILGAYLSSCGHQIIIVDHNEERKKAIEDKGLHITGKQNIHVSFDKYFKSVSELRKIDPEIIFIAVKAVDIKCVLNKLSKLRKTNLLIISFQNGLYTEREYFQYFAPNQVLRVIINYAGYYIKENEIIMSFFNGANYIGCFNKDIIFETKAIADLLSASGLKTIYVENIEYHEWKKGIINACLLPVTAITGLSMKEAIDSPDLYKIVEEVLKECIYIAKAKGYDYGLHFYNETIQYLKKAGHHQTSMYYDIIKKKKTEINFVNGMIADLGEQLGISCMCNRTLTSLIHGLEARYLGY